MSGDLDTLVQNYKEIRVAKLFGEAKHDRGISLSQNVVRLLWHDTVACALSK